MLILNNPVFSISYNHILIFVIIRKSKIFPNGPFSVKSRLNSEQCWPLQTSNFKLISVHVELSIHWMAAIQVLLSFGTWLPLSLRAGGSRGRKGNKWKGPKLRFPDSSAEEVPWGLCQDASRRATAPLAIKRGRERARLSGPIRDWHSPILRAPSGRKGKQSRDLMLSHLITAPWSKSHLGRLSPLHFISPSRPSFSCQSRRRKTLFFTPNTSAMLAVAQKVRFLCISDFALALDGGRNISSSELQLIPAKLHTLSFAESPARPSRSRPLCY